jgi:hypothetical protein
MIRPCDLGSYLFFKKEPLPSSPRASARNIKPRQRKTGPRRALEADVREAAYLHGRLCQDRLDFDRLGTTKT